MGCPSLAPETWAQIISYIPQQGDGMDGGRAAGKEIQVEYARLLRVSKVSIQSELPTSHASISPPSERIVQLGVVFNSQTACQPEARRFRIRLWTRSCHDTS